MAQGQILGGQPVELVAEVENRLAWGIGGSMDIGGQVALGGVYMSLHFVFIGDLRFESEVTLQVEMAAAGSALCER